MVQAKAQAAVGKALKTVDAKKLRKASKTLNTAQRKAAKAKQAVAQSKKAQAVKKSKTVTPKRASPKKAVATGPKKVSAPKRSGPKKAIAPKRMGPKKAIAPKRTGSKKVVVSKRTGPKKAQAVKQVAGKKGKKGGISLANVQKRVKSLNNKVADAKKNVRVAKQTGNPRKVAQATQALKKTTAVLQKARVKAVKAKESHKTAVFMKNLIAKNKAARVSSALPLFVVCIKQVWLQYALFVVVVSVLFFLARSASTPAAATALLHIQTGSFGEPPTPTVALDLY